MGYEIIVIRDGKHFFATHERSAGSFETAASIASELHKRFPKEEGFQVLIYRSERTSYPVVIK